MNVNSLSEKSRTNGFFLPNAQNKNPHIVNFANTMFIFFCVFVNKVLTRSNTQIFIPHYIAKRLKKW